MSMKNFQWKKYEGIEIKGNDGKIYVAEHSRQCLVSNKSDNDPCRGCVNYKKPDKKKGFPMLRSSLLWSYL